MGDFEYIKKQLDDAMYPEDVFGKSYDHKTFRSIAKIVHPDANGGSLQAKKLFDDLNAFNKHAEELVKAGTYGHRRHRLPGREVVIINKNWIMNKPLVAGSIADLHLVHKVTGSTTKNHVLKVVRSYENNDLLAAEARNINRIREQLTGNWLDCIPEIKETILLDEGAVQKRINVMTYFDNFLTVSNIRTRFVDAGQQVDGRSLGWMWRRMLKMCEAIHHCGIIHGAILPPHVMFYPDNDGNVSTKDPRKHAIRLVGWANSIDTRSRTKLSVVDKNWKFMYAPEILAKEKLGPTTDMYMGAATLLNLVYGTLNQRKMYNPSISIPIQQSLLQCIEKDPKNRPQNPKKHFEALDALLLKEFGPRAWHPFNIP